MKSLRQHIEKLRQVRRSEHHPLIYTLHKKHKVSKRTLFYIKEYGPHSHVARTILKESMQIILLTSIISSFGGLALERIKPLFIQVIPLIIMLPTLNAMIGDYGIIVSSRFSTMLHEGRVNREIWSTRQLRILFAQIMLIGGLTAVISTLLSFVATSLMGNAINMVIASKLALIILVDVLALILILFATSVLAGCYFYYKREDPNNFLIPITTSIADFGNMVLLSLLVVLFF